MNRLSAFSEEVYALLRFVSGAMFAFHGAQIVLGLYSVTHPAIGSQVWIGGVIELVGGSAIALGTRTRLAAFLCSGTMAVAYIQYHWKFATGRRFFPALNEGELALLYSLVFLYISCRGSGRWSLAKD